VDEARDCADTIDRERRESRYIAAEAGDRTHGCGRDNKPCDSYDANSDESAETSYSELAAFHVRCR